MCHSDYLSAIDALLWMVMRITKRSVANISEILDTSHLTITNSPGEGVASGQADPAVGVRSQALPIPADECGVESGESSELLRGGRSHGNT